MNSVVPVTLSLILMIFPTAWALPTLPLLQYSGIDPNCTCQKGSWESGCSKVQCECSQVVSDLSPRTWSSLELNCSFAVPSYNVCDKVVILSLMRCQLNSSYLLVDHFARLFPNLRELSVTDIRLLGGGSLELLTPDLQFEHVVKLDLRWNEFKSIPGAVLHAFARLSVLLLDHNNLTCLDRFNFAHGWNLKAISLSGNCWSCSDMQWFIEWIRQQPRTSRPLIMYPNATWCHHSDGRKKGQTTLANLIELCPADCTCSLNMLQVNVDCRHQRLTEFPATVPVNTSTMHLENNRIASLVSLVRGNNYDNLRYLYLDNNSISSIDPLEKAACFNELVTLYLTGNRLQMIPSFIINRLIREVLTEVKLADNPWDCDCKTVSQFYELMIRYPKRFLDRDAIRCSDNSTQYINKVIYQLKKFDLCADYYDKNHSYIHPSDIINPILICLICAVVVKLAYDFAMLKFTGKVPCGPLTLLQRDYYSSRHAQDAS